MLLQPGSTLGPYEVTAKIGAGGMGEVYRARDTKLDRDVALKVLPEAFTADPDRLARFEREAKVLASLNHPHIGHIYGLEEADGQKALVLELIEGPTLADRITEGPIPLDEALPIAGQIAEALEAAHEQGIIHRDLKPANVKVKSDGTVKVLDFGLAKALEPQKGDPDLSQSPTLTARATQMGVVLGTAPYMSPEQARGKPVDKRTDIWALGCVLYEMLTGERAFTGSDVTDTLASVLRSEPEWATLPPSTPVLIRRLLRRCLEKSPEKRLRDIGDAKLELEDARAGDPEPPAPAVASGGRMRLAFAALGVAALALALGVVLGRSGGRGVGDESLPPPSQPATRTVVNLSGSAPIALGTQVPLIGFASPVLALSPDGRHLVYVGQTEEGTRLYHRDLTRFEDPQLVPGTEGALYAFFAPDSSELGFLTQARVKKVALGGGAAQTLCRARSPVSATWIGDTIYFADAEGGMLNSVAAGGGDPSELLDVFQRLGSWGKTSTVLPGGRAALVSVRSRDSISSDYAEIRAFSLEGGDDKTLAISGYDARYLPSGHLVFGRGGSLLAAPFDVERLELLGEPVALPWSVALESIFGNVHAAVAATGTVALVPGQDLARGRLAWADRQGNGGVLPMEEQVYGTFDIAPDDGRFAVQVVDVRDYVSIWDAAEGGRGREVAIPGSVGWPLWSPDGTALALLAKPGGSATYDVVLHELQGGSTKELLSTEDHVRPYSWVRPGRMGITRGGRVEILNVLSPEEPLWVREALTMPALSPDGSWIAYVSSEGTGRSQIWLEEIDGETRQQVSTGGGVEPSWCRECGELFYRQSNRVLASRITQKPQLVIGPPRVVFEAPGFVDTPGISFRVSSDGERLYYVRRSEPPTRDRILIVHNWFSELERLVPVD